MAKDKRITLTVKLTAGIDDDLIHWWMALERGSNKAPETSRNTHAKKVLRIAMSNSPSLIEYEAKLLAEQRANESLNRRLEIELRVQEVMSGELERAQQTAVQLQGDIDLLRQQSSHAYDQQDREIQLIKTTLSKLPIITQKSVEAAMLHSSPQNATDSTLADIQSQLDSLVQRIEEVAQMRGGKSKSTPRRTLSDDEISARDRRLKNTNW